MNGDLRTAFRRLAPSPSRELDVTALMSEGRRRRRFQMVGLAAAASVVVIAAAFLVSQLDPPRDQSKPIPADTVTPPHEPTPVRNPLDDLPQGWTELPSPPEARSRSAAIGWTGDTLIVWSGYVYTGFGDEAPEPDGFAFDAEAQEWRDIADSPLAPRVKAASAWTGTEFLVWGGSDDRYLYFDDGAAYDPARDTWRTLPDAPIDARAPLSVWTGTELIVWGTFREIPARSRGGHDLLRDGAAFNPTTNEWRRISDSPIELARADAVWTGREMIVFGGSIDPENEPDATPYAMGAAYDPATDRWRRLPEPSLTDNSSTAAWNGSEMIAWDYLLASAAYDPATNEWRSIPGVPLEDYECVPQSAAVGNDIFGNYCGAQVLYSSSTQRWSRVKPPTSDQYGWGYTLTSADPVVLLLGRNVETKQETFLAYRPHRP